MKLGSIVIVSLVAPHQRFIGRLLGIEPAGVTVRGIDMDGFEDWVGHVASADEAGVHPTTTFFPLHRVEKMIRDESTAALLSFADAFRKRVGRPIESYLEES